ncbi:MAG: hypothetical protein E8D45_07530, partial [Nitrospira sp.]
MTSWRWGQVGSLALVMVIGINERAVGQSEPITVADSETYFQDTVGSRWEYRGHLSEGPMQTIEEKIFTNISTVTGTTTLKGVTVQVFHDSNAGNHGASDSYY